MFLGAGQPAISPLGVEPLVSGELVHNEFELQAHREQTCARLGFMRMRGAGNPPQYSSIPPRPPDVGNLARPPAPDQYHSVQYPSPPQQLSSRTDSYPRSTTSGEMRFASDPYRPPTWEEVKSVCSQSSSYSTSHSPHPNFFPNCHTSTETTNNSHFSPHQFHGVTLHTLTTSTQNLSTPTYHSLPLHFPCASSQTQAQYYPPSLPQTPNHLFYPNSQPPRQPPTAMVPAYLTPEPAPQNTPSPAINTSPFISTNTTATTTIYQPNFTPTTKSVPPLSTVSIVDSGQPSLTQGPMNQLKGSGKLLSAQQGSGKDHIDAKRCEFRESLKRTTDTCISEFREELRLLLDSWKSPARRVDDPQKFVSPQSSTPELISVTTGSLKSANDGSQVDMSLEFGSFHPSSADLIAAAVDDSVVRNSTNTGLNLLQHEVRFNTGISTEPVASDLSITSTDEILSLNNDISVVVLSGSSGEHSVVDITDKLNVMSNSMSDSMENTEYAIQSTVGFVDDKELNEIESVTANRDKMNSEYVRDDELVPPDKEHSVDSVIFAILDGGKFNVSKSANSCSDFVLIKKGINRNVQTWVGGLDNNSGPIQRGGDAKASSNSSGNDKKIGRMKAIAPISPMCGSLVSTPLALKRNSCPSFPSSGFLLQNSGDTQKHDNVGAKQDIYRLNLSEKIRMKYHPLHLFDELTQSSALCNVEGTKATHAGIRDKGGGCSAHLEIVDAALLLIEFLSSSTRVLLKIEEKEESVVMENDKEPPKMDSSEQGSEPTSNSVLGNTELWLHDCVSSVAPFAVDVTRLSLVESAKQAKVWDYLPRLEDILPLPTGLKLDNNNEVCSIGTQSRTQLLLWFILWFEIGKCEAATEPPPSCKKALAEICQVIRTSVSQIFTTIIISPQYFSADPDKVLSNLIKLYVIFYSAYKDNVGILLHDDICGILGTVVSSLVTLCAYCVSLKDVYGIYDCVRKKSLAFRTTMVIEYGTCNHGKGLLNWLQAEMDLVTSNTGFQRSVQNYGYMLNNNLGNTKYFSSARAYSCASQNCNSMFQNGTTLFASSDSINVHHDDDGFPVLYESGSNEEKEMMAQSIQECMHTETNDMMVSIDELKSASTRPPCLATDVFLVVEEMLNVKIGCNGTEMKSEENLMAALASFVEKVCSGGTENGDLEQSCKNVGFESEENSVLQGVSLLNHPPLHDVGDNDKCALVAADLYRPTAIVQVAAVSEHVVMIILEDYLGTISHQHTDSILTGLDMVGSCAIIVSALVLMGTCAQLLSHCKSRITKHFREWAQVLDIKSQKEIMDDPVSLPQKEFHGFRLSAFHNHSTLHLIKMPKESCITGWVTNQGDTRLWGIDTSLCGDLNDEAVTGFAGNLSLEDKSVL